MNFKKIIMLINLVFCLLNGFRYDEYAKLKLSCDSPSIRKEDLPDEFSDKAFKTVDEFIKKTYELDYECLIYFDYITGEILKFSLGKLDKVKLQFVEGEFDDYHVASMHNHPSNVFSPPSGKNFGILARDFEDYELIASREELWILKAKGTYEYLVGEMKIFADALFISSIERCSNRYNDEKIIEKMGDLVYGNQLSKYINDKNINGIQLTKKRYVNMKTKPNTQVSEYGCLKKDIINAETIRLARERERDPNILSGKDRVYVLYQMVGMEIDYDDIFPELDDYTDF